MKINITELAEEFKKEHLPDAEIPYHFEAEAWGGIKHFVRWVNEKQNKR